MTRGTRVYLTRIQKRLKNNSSICSFLFFFFLRLIIEHNFGVLIRAYKFAPSTLAPCTCMYVCVCVCLCVYMYVCTRVAEMMYRFRLNRYDRRIISTIETKERHVEKASQCGRISIHNRIA